MSSSDFDSSDSDSGTLPNKRRRDAASEMQNLSRLDGGASLQNFISSLIKCAVCLETFSEPRSLPCLHTFCHKCLESLHHNSFSLTTTIKCPTCGQRAEFPPNGISGFPHNFIVQNLISADQQSSEYCGQHSHDLAVKFCFDCNDLLCEDCDENHPLGHNAKSIKDAATHFTQKINEITEKLSQFRQLGDYVGGLKADRKMINDVVKRFTQHITERGSFMKNAIDKHVKKLVKDVTDKGHKILQEIEIKSDSVRSPNYCLKNLKSASQKLRTEFKLSKLSLAIADLDKKMKKLKDELSNVVIENYSCPLIHFEPAGRQVFDIFNFKKNCIGSISLITQDEDASPYYRKKALLVAKIDFPVDEEIESIEGCAQLDGKLFAAFYEPAVIAVLPDRPPYTRLPDIVVPGMSKPCCMVACSEVKCLYVADEVEMCVWRVRVDEEGTVDKFMCLRDELADGILRISLSIRSSRLLVAVTRLRRILVLGADGKELHNVDTSQVKSRYTPIHAVETARETFVVSFYGDSDDVFIENRYMSSDQFICEIDQRGTLIREYNLGCLEVRRIALDYSGNVLGFCISGSGVLMLNNRLNFMGQFLARDTEWSYYVNDLCYDDASGRLIVSGGKHIFLYHIK